MVNWKLFGERPPLSESDWIAEFEKYKQFPEFKMYCINTSIRACIIMLINTTVF